MVPSLVTIHCLTTYKEACQRGEVAIGKMLVVETNQLHGPTYVINFPTKKHWRAPSQLSYIDALLVRHHKRQPAHAKLEPSPPPVERCFVYSPLGLALVIAPSHDGVRRPRGSVTPAAAWEAQGTNSPPRNRWCDVRWLELWHVDKEAALSGCCIRL